MRPWLVLLATSICISCGAKKSSDKTPADVRWTVAWKWATPSSATATDTDVVLVRTETGPRPTTIALDVTTGKERWRVDDWVVSGVRDRRLYVIDEQATSLVAREIDAGTGESKRSIVIERASPLVEWVVADGAIVTMDRVHVEAFSLESGRRLWSIPSTRRKLEFLGVWSGLAVFQHPYAAVSIETGDQVWSVSGWGFAAELDSERTVAQLDDEVAVVARDGTITKWPGRIRAARAGAFVYQTADAMHLFEASTNQSRAIRVSDVLPISPMTLDGDFLYFYTADSALWEFDVVAGSAALVCHCASAPSNAILSTPIIDGDRVYADDRGWAAIDRAPSKRARAPVR